MRNYLFFELEKLVRNGSAFDYNKSQGKTQVFYLRQFKSWSLLPALQQDIDFSLRQLTIAFGGAR